MRASPEAWQTSASWLRAGGNSAVIATNQIQRIVSNRGILLWLIVLPLVIMFVLSLVLNGLLSGYAPAQPFRVAVAQNGPTAHADIVDSFSSRPEWFTVEILLNEEKVKHAVQQREVDVGVFIPMEFPSGVVSVWAEPGRPAADAVARAVHQMALEAYLDRAIEGRTVNMDRIVVERAESSGGSSLKDGSDQGFGQQPMHYVTVMLAAFYIMSASQLAIVYCASDDRSGVYNRVSSLGVSRFTYLTGVAISSVVTGIFFMVVMRVSTRLLFHVHWGDGLTWTVLTLIGSIAIASVSMLMLMLAPSPKHVRTVSNAFIMVLGFLGGAFIPLQFMPEWIVSTFRWLPNRAVRDGYLTLADGGGFSHIADELTTLGLAIPVMLLLATTANWVRARKGR